MQVSSLQTITEGFCCMSV